MIRMGSVILVESVPLFRRGIRTTLERAGEWAVFESTDRMEIMELTQAHHPACAILDGGLTTIDPFEICWMLRQQVPEIGILVLAPTQNEECFFQFFRRGASAYELRSITPEALVEGMRRVSRGEYLIRSEVLLPQPSARITQPLKTHQHGEVSVGEPQAPAPA